MTLQRFLPFALNFRTGAGALGYCSLSIAAATLVLCGARCVSAGPSAIAPENNWAATNPAPAATLTAFHQETADQGKSAQETSKGGASNKDTSDTETSPTETSDRASSDGDVAPPAPLAPATVAPATVAPATVAPADAPLESRERVVRTIRFAVVVVATLLAMFSTVVLLKINRLTHGKYMGRLWWAGVVLVVGWLLAGWLWAWNNDLWAKWLDGPLL